MCFRWPLISAWTPLYTFIEPSPRAQSITSGGEAIEETVRRASGDLITGIVAVSIVIFSSVRRSKLMALSSMTRYFETTAKISARILPIVSVSTPARSCASTSLIRLLAADDEPGLLWGEWGKGGGGEFTAKENSGNRLGERSRLRWRAVRGGEGGAGGRGGRFR